jgi:hypothetical protein
MEYRDDIWKWINYAEIIALSICTIYYIYLNIMLWLS